MRTPCECMKLGLKCWKKPELRVKFPLNLMRLQISAIKPLDSWNRDGANLKVTNNPEANKLLHYDYRPGREL